MEVDLLLRGVIAPLFGAVAVLFVSWSAGTRLRGIALVTALVISCAVQEPLDAFPPRSLWQWMPIACVAATLVGSIAGDRAIDRAGRVITCLVAALLACVLLPLPDLAGTSTRLTLALALAASSAMMLPLAMHRGGLSFWLGSCIALCSTAALVLLTGFAKLAIPVGAVGATCAATAALALRAPHRALHAGISGGIAITSVAALGCASALAFDTGGMPPWIPALCALSPLGLWLGEAAPFRASRWTAALARMLGVAVPAFAAVVAAVLHSQRAPHDADAYAVRTDVHAAAQPETRHATP